MHGERGSSAFTIVELLVAVVLIGVGLLALAGSSTLVARMLAAARRTSWATQTAERRLERLRRQAWSTTPACTSLSSGSAPRAGGVDERWEAVPGPGAVLIRVIVSWSDGRRQITDTVATAIDCS